MFIMLTGSFSASVSMRMPFADEKVSWSTSARTMSS
jgi:hypothetical protein